MPVRRTFPPGFTLKHVHGGPTYVYVIAGSLDITDSQGTVTYAAGDFFWEPPGYIHTAQTAAGAEVFILFLLPPPAEAIIPTP
jgi:quercetin dioxygenase-like cupin family protein